MRALAWLVLLSAMAAAPARAAEPGTLSARIDGRPWVATQVMAVTFRFGPNPALNIAAQREGPPTSKLSFNLVLPADDDYAHDFALASARARTSHANFLLVAMTPESADTTFRFERGELTVERYDAARRTISGRFSGIANNGAGTRTIHITDGRFADIPVLAGP